MRHFVILYMVCVQGPRILDIVPPKGASYPQPLYVVHGPRSGPQDVVPLDIVCRRRRLRQLVALTQYVVRGTRSVAQDVVCPPQAVRRYVTLTQDIVP